jgi:hypothetical protein
MKRIALFVEGQTEMVFLQSLLHWIFGYNIRYICKELSSYNIIPWKQREYGKDNPSPDIDFIIINVGGEGTLINAIKDREEKLVEQGFERIIGIKDMYSEEYEKHVVIKVIDDSITQKFVEGMKKTISTMKNPNRIELHFAIMEIEAWFLMMHKVFERIDPILTVEYIKEKLEKDLLYIDPQKEFFKPASFVEQILGLSGLKYKKTLDDVNRIVSRLTETDIQVSLHSNKCQSFKDFYRCLESVISQH